MIKPELIVIETNELEKLDLIHPDSPCFIQKYSNLVSLPNKRPDPNFNISPLEINHGLYDFFWFFKILEFFFFLFFKNLSKKIFLKTSQSSVFFIIKFTR